MQEGTIVFYIDNGHIYSGRIMDVECSRADFTFSIDSYGDCSGQFRISSGQIGRTVFLDKEDAVKAVQAGEQKDENINRRR